MPVIKNIMFNKKNDIVGIPPVVKANLKYYVPFSKVIVI